MKKIQAFFLAAAVFFASGILSCEKKTGSDAVVSIDKDTSYAIGMYLAEQWRMPLQAQYNYKSFMEGFRDFNEEQETRLSRDEAIAKIQALFMQITEVMEGQGREEGEKYLAENRKKPGIIITDSGLQYEVITQGTGPRPNPDDMIHVHYEGTLIDGTVFDSSYNRGEPALFYLDSLITGWKEGIQLMNTGSSYRFFIPSDLAYGSLGMGGMIPPNAVLIFKVELLEIEEK